MPNEPLVNVQAKTVEVVEPSDVLPRNLLELERNLKITQATEQLLNKGAVTELTVEKETDIGQDERLFKRPPAPKVSELVDVPLAPSRDLTQETSLPAEVPQNLQNVFIESSVVTPEDTQPEPLETVSDPASLPDIDTSLIDPELFSSDEFFMPDLADVDAVLNSTEMQQASEEVEDYTKLEIEDLEVTITFSEEQIEQASLLATEYLQPLSPVEEEYIETVAINIASLIEELSSLDISLDTNKEKNIDQLEELCVELLDFLQIEYEPQTIAKLVRWLSVNGLDKTKINQVEDAIQINAEEGTYEQKLSRVLIANILLLMGFYDRPSISFLGKFALWLESQQIQLSKLNIELTYS